jgi:hypothetical protein
VSLQLIRVVESNYPGEIQEVYRRGSEYLYVWTIPGDLAGPPFDEHRLPSSVSGAGSDGTSWERTVCFPAHADGTVTALDPIASATGPGSREKLLAQLREASGDPS